MKPINPIFRKKTPEEERAARRKHIKQGMLPSTKANILFRLVMIFTLIMIIVGIVYGLTRNPKFEYEGHRYIRMGIYGASVHDPDCPCHKDKNEDK